MRKIRAACPMWQSRWDKPSEDRWKHRLIPNNRMWSERKHENTNFLITKFLAGHRFCYRQYLHRFGVDDSPNCLVCGSKSEDPKHVMFHCPRFGLERKKFEPSAGKDHEPKDAIVKIFEVELKINTKKINCSVWQLNTVDPCVSMDRTLKALINFYIYPATQQRAWCLSVNSPFAEGIMIIMYLQLQTAQLVDCMCKLDQVNSAISTHFFNS